MLTEIVSRIVNVADPDKLILFGIEKPVDVIVATPEDLERYKDSNYLVLKSALKEGRILNEKESKPQTTGLREKCCFWTVI